MIFVVKLSMDNSCRMIVERVVIPKDKERFVNQVASEGNLNQALEMANKCEDPTIKSNILLRNSWEKSNRTLKDIEITLKKIKDSTYIIKQCICNASPNKHMYREEALDFINVQKELISLAITIMAKHNFELASEELDPLFLM
mmetsp:Transcript_9724/g.10919  ORF Transcript_9724/g.10919 Transcript_9724/m.10919 type:complete len:143 (-) Transcript_9724:2741-3169(-)